MLHSYYNGIENILLLIAKGIDSNVPNSGKWHSELLNSMFNKTEKRNALFTDELQEALTDYMNFRHFFRHSYGYSLKWEKAAPLFLGMVDNWKAVKCAVENFLNNN